MKELKAELKRGILHGKIIYVMMMVAILFALGWTENLSQAIEFRENANVVLDVYKRQVICIAATVLCVAMTSMAYAKEIETTTEDDETYYTLEVKRKPYDIEKIASVVLGEDYQRDKEYERYWYNEEGTL